MSTRVLSARHLLSLVFSFTADAQACCQSHAADTPAAVQPHPAWRHVTALSAQCLAAPGSTCRPAAIPQIMQITAPDLPAPPCAGQVFHVFAALCPAMDLTVGLACGRHSQAAEASALAGLQTRDAGPSSQLDALPWLQPAAVDILVATPGRLMHYLQALGSSFLSALRFLVS